MRSSKSRSRSKANRPRSIGNIINRVFDSSGPEGKVRGTPQQIIEKYQILARDAQLSNDRVAAENFMQHAEHYTRLLGEAMREMAAEQEERQRQFQPPANGNGNGNGNGYRENQGGQPRDGQPREGQSRDYQPREGQNRDTQNRDRGDRPEYRPEPRDPGSADQPLIAEPAGFDDSDSMLVETPEMAPRSEHRSEPRSEPRPAQQPRNDQRREGENRVKSDPRDRRDNRPRPPRDDRPAEQPAAAAPAEPAPVAAVAPAEPAAKPRKPAAPRKPRKPAEKAEAGADTGKPEVAE